MTGRKEGENSPVKAFPTKNSPRFTCGQQQGGLSNRKLPSGSGPSSPGRRGSAFQGGLFGSGHFNL